ncbi:hypothetical protein [Ruania alba]|uniref:Uncharacterized protein n=1 Tax=Ruania alba TaxID=648782 RepID=A0A1H5K838_9MICO|nr:hypothetical protein [Ruania alba]SEE60657.1 hypothetical protein SAMN04488554_2123 [Ruania alba]
MWTSLEQTRIAALSPTTAVRTHDEHKPILNRRNFLVLAQVRRRLPLASCAGGSAESGPDEITGAGWSDGLNDLVFGQIKTDFEAASG